MCNWDKSVSMTEPTLLFRPEQTCDYSLRMNYALMKMDGQMPGPLPENIMEVKLTDFEIDFIENYTTKFMIFIPSPNAFFGFRLSTKDVTEIMKQNPQGLVNI